MLKVKTDHRESVLIATISCQWHSICDIRIIGNAMARTSKQNNIFSVVALFLLCFSSDFGGLTWHFPTSSQFHARSNAL